MNDEDKTVDVVFGDNEIKTLNIDKTRCYLSGITELYRKSGLIKEDGSYSPKKSIWKIYNDKVEIVLKEE